MASVVMGICLLIMIFLFHHLVTCEFRLYGEDKNHWSKTFKPTLIVLIISMGMCVAIPEQSDVVKMYGANLVLNNKQIKTLSTNSLELLDNYIAKQLKESKEDES
jgi:hypothetical protein